MNLVFFGILVIAQYIMDRMTNTCTTYTGEVLLFFHHIVAAYIYFGPFFFNPFYHLIFAVIVLIHWYTYKACILTVYTNRYCGVEESKPFRDIIRMAGLNQLHKNIHWMMMYMIIIYDVCLIHSS